MTHELSDDGKALVHVVNEYRWLAAAVCNYREYRDGKRARGFANVDVAFLDSAPVHARALIEFYGRGGGTDIPIARHLRRRP